jgi:hypothetical protein
MRYNDSHQLTSIAGLRGFDLGSARQAAAETDLPGFEVGPDFQPSSISKPVTVAPWRGGCSGDRSAGFHVPMPRKLTYERLRERFPTVLDTVLKDAVAIAADAESIPRRELYDLIILANDDERARTLFHQLALRAHPAEQDNASNAAVH